MSVKIDNMGATSFTSSIIGLSRSLPDYTTFAMTCSTVKAFITTILILLTSNANIPVNITWSNVLTNSIKSSSTMAIRGSVIRLGNNSTTVKILGNTLNINSNFSTIVTGAQNMSRIQAGYVTLPIGSTLLTPPNVITGSPSVFVTGTASGIVGYNGIGSTGFTLVSTVSQEVNWIYMV